MAYRYRPTSTVAPTENDQETITAVDDDQKTVTPR
jgi:hypothetical protein